MFPHNETDKIYIGSAFNAFKRLKDYYSTYYLKQANIYICNALFCHTYIAFSLLILEILRIQGRLILKKKHK